MTRPYAGSSYTRLTIPLQQQIPAGGSDAFLIAVGEPALVLPEDDTLALTLHYNGATDSATREIKLIFNSWNSQRIDNMEDSALEKRLGTTFPLIAGMGRDQASAS
jgi:hypothetical protein